MSRFRVMNSFVDIDVKIFIKPKVTFGTNFEKSKRPAAATSARRPAEFVPPHGQRRQRQS